MEKTISRRSRLRMVMDYLQFVIL